jgi:hypothetical protein
MQSAMGQKCMIDILHFNAQQSHRNNELERVAAGCSVARIFNPSFSTGRIENPSYKTATPDCNAL